VKLVDTHCHLQSDAYVDNRDEIVARALNADIAAIINAATEPSDWKACRALKSAYPSCEFALGIHPWYISDDSIGYVRGLSSTDFNGACAIGEIGLDKKYRKIDFAVQMQILRMQIELARDCNLPVMLHCVAAFSECAAELKRCPLKRGGVIHNFNGSAELAKDLSRYGLFFSLGGTLTYRDSRKRTELLSYIYPSLFMLETDSPDIPPAEKRGLMNEPSFIRYNLAAAAEILSVSEEAIAEATTRNAADLFGLNI
jgi:TatD DNase family protein